MVSSGFFGGREECKRLRVDLPRGDMVAFVHDPLGRRIAKKVNGMAVEKYLWQGRTRLLAVSGGAGALKACFEYADGRLPEAMIKESAWYFLVYNQAGSLRAVLDSARPKEKVGKRIKSERSR